MAVQFNGGVVIGADSRTTTGSYIVRLRFNFSRFLDLILACHHLPLTLVGQSSNRQIDIRA